MVYKKRKCIIFIFSSNVSFGYLLESAQFPEVLDTLFLRMFSLIVMLKQ